MLFSVQHAADRPSVLSLLLVGGFVGLVIGRVIFGRKATYAAGYARGEADATASADARASVINVVQQRAGGTDHHDEFGAGWDLDHLRTLAGANHHDDLRAFHDHVHDVAAERAADGGRGDAGRLALPSDPAPGPLDGSGLVARGDRASKVVR